MTGSMRMVLPLERGIRLWRTVLAQCGDRSGEAVEGQDLVEG